ncbi:MAG: hypothetical protein J7L47_11055 [Candidatus Odinarchaeota archaeon]|nr:hypothetical protein [Candidatus Odinarchaeota archaeon]
MVLPDTSTLRREILLKVGAGLEIVVKKFPGNKLIQYLILPEAIKFFAASKTEDGAKKSEELLNNMNKYASHFIRKYLESLREKYIVS